MKFLTDEDLVRQYLKTQENVYFTGIYTRYCDKVYRKCLYYCKDPELAADYTHDIFLKVLTRLSSFKHESRFSTWLYSITYNYCMDQARFKKKDALVHLDNQLLPDIEDSDEDLMEIPTNGINKALGLMTPDERTLLLLRYQDDFSYKEIGNILNTSEQAAKMRVNRAKSKLHKYYQETLLVVLALLARWMSKFPFRFF